MKAKVKFESHGRGCSDILLNGTRIGRISGSSGMYYVMFRRSTDTPEIRDTAVARFKYMNPVSKAKKFVKEILKYATPTEIVETLGGGDPNRPTPLVWLQTLQSQPNRAGHLINF